MKEIKLMELEKSYESGVITKEEYEKQKKHIEEMQEEKPEEKRHEGDAKDAHINIKSDKLLITGAVLLILIFAAILGFRYLIKEKPQSIDELHALNFKGKLKPEQGYIYKGTYSFVKYDDLWYTQMKSPKGSRLYNVQFRFGPKDVESIDIAGSLDWQLFNNATEYYVTFNPTGNDFSSVALAVGDFNQQMTKIFFKSPIAACDRNETRACVGRPIINCNNADKITLYVKEENKTAVHYDNKCIVVEGRGFELVKSVDRVLYDFYGIHLQ